MKNRIAVYPGTFDPITNGHLDIIERGLLNKTGILVVESSKRMIWDGELKGIELFDRRRYGDTVVSFYKNKF